MNALDRELGDDPIQIMRAAKHRNVVHVAPARRARILDDADYPHVSRGVERTAPTYRAASGPAPYSSTGTSRVAGGT